MKEGRGGGKEEYHGRKERSHILKEGKLEGRHTGRNKGKKEGGEKGREERTGDPTTRVKKALSFSLLLVIGCRSRGPNFRFFGLFAFFSF
jgi:hypothetical protein